MHRLLARWLALAAALVLLPPETPAQTPQATADSPSARVDALFAAMAREDSPGCALGVYRDGTLAYVRGYGMADLERRVPITPHTVFDIASTSKQFSAASVVLLAQEGKLSLDDDVRRWVPELPAYERPITIRHLLHHTSGVRDYIGLLTLSGARIDDVTTDEEALAAIVRQRELNFSPGAEFLYSNSGYFLLSVIVERAAGVPLREFARENIFAPLGMTRTHYLGSYDDVVPDRALAYSPRRGGGFRTDMSRWLQTGDGAVFTTVEELLLWDRNFYEPRVGGEAMLAELLRPGTLTDGETLDYALGLIVGSHRGARTVNHGGAWGGYRAQLVRFPDQRFSVAVLCNSATANPTRLAHEVADIYLGDVLEPPAAAGSTPAGPLAPAAELPPAVLQRLVGTYRGVASGTLAPVTIADGKLFVALGSRYELRPRSPEVFDVVDGPIPATVTFEEAGAGEARRMVLRAEGQAPVAFELVQLVTPDARELAAYAGAYFSEELQATYTVVVDGEALRIRRRGAEPLALRATTHDAFTAGGTTLRFVRGPGGEVAGFLLGVGRVRNLRFERVRAD